ncbi:MAG: hypothetical protein IJR51_07725 [Clostridia bacterium]|nr:hypothetical protein [Clostridia bacterium]
MKKLLSIFLAAVLMCSALTLLGTSLQAFADWSAVEIFTYDADGNMSQVDFDHMPSNISVFYDNNLFIGGRRFVEVSLENSDDIHAYYFKCNADFLRVIIKDTVQLYAKKMTQEGETFYACLASNKEMHIIGGIWEGYETHSKLVVTIGTAGLPDKSLEAPVTLLSANKDIVYLEGENRRFAITLEVNILLQLLEHTNGNTVSVARGKLYTGGPNEVTIDYEARTAVQINSETEISLSDRTYLYIDFYGSDVSQDSTSFKKVIYWSDFAGGVWTMLNRGGGFEVESYIEHYWSSVARNGDTAYAAVIAKTLHYETGNEHNISAAAIKKALDEKIRYRLGETLPGFISGDGFVLQINWKTLIDSTSLTGTKIEGGKAYLATVNVVPRKSYCYSNLTDSIGQGTYTEAKPESALNASNLPASEASRYDTIAVLYPSIDADKAPYFTQDPVDQDWTKTQYGYYPATMSFSVKAKNDETAVYQWYAGGTKLENGDVFSGVNTNVLVIKDIPAAREAYGYSYYCELSSPIYDTVRSATARMNTYYQLDEVMVSKLDKPVEGAKPDKKYQTNYTPAYVPLTEETIVYSNAVTGDVYPDDYTFKRGDKVKITITIKILTEGYVFLNPTFKANWEEGGQSWLADTPDKKTAVFSFNATVSATPGEIDFVNLSLGKPVIGEKLPYNIETPENADYLVYDVYPTPYYDGIALAGKEYTYKFKLMANSGHYFAEDARIRLNGTLLTPKFNEDRTIAELEYVFPAQNAAIGTVELTVVPPQYGEVFDNTKYSVEPDGPDKANFRAVGGSWDVMTDADKIVLDGYTRGLTQPIVANEGYYFTPSTSIIIHYLDGKGKTAHRMLNNDLTANADSMDLKIIFDPYPAIHEHEGVTYYQIEGNLEQHYFNCKFCHKLIYEDHTAGDWIVDKPATATEDGSKHKECTKCHMTLETESIPKGTSGPDYTLGDIDGKDGITAADARLALRASVGLENYAKGSREFLAADVDLSETITAADARLILRRAVGFTDPEWGKKA